MPQQRIFGGQVVAQCLMAANETVAGALTAHSLHAYFLRAGDPSTPIDFEVDPIRDGRSFSTRRVVARQNGEAIFNTSISYQVTEDGVGHSIDMPNVEIPEFNNQPEIDKNGKLRFPLLDRFAVERMRGAADRATGGKVVQNNW